jgi:hypothetical protein
MNKTYHGWILVEDGGKDYKDFIYTEYTNKDGDRIRTVMTSRGESGCAEAVEWWDKQVGQPIKLERSFARSYRVYTKQEQEDE